MNLSFKYIKIFGMSEPLKSESTDGDSQAETKRTILTEERTESWQSYLMLAMYMIFISSYGYNVLYIQPIARSMKKAFEVKDTDLSNLLTLGSISSAIFFLPLIYIVTMKGIKISCLIGLGLLTIGTLIELFISKEYNLIYLGHFITHAGSPVFNIANAKFCSIWFGPKNRPMALTLNMMTSTVGLMLAFIVPGIFVHSNADLTQEGVVNEIRNFHFYLASIYGGSFLLCLLFFKESPEKYTTYKHEEKEIRKNFKMFRQLKDLLVEPTFLYFNLVVGLGVSSVVINQLLIVQMMTPFNFSQQQCQIGGALIVLGGLIGSIGYSKLFITLPNQLAKLKYLYLIILLVYTMYGYVPSFKSLWALYPAAFFLGFFGMTQLAIAIESLIKYIIITGPQRLVIGTGTVQVVLSFTNGFYSLILRSFLAEGTVEGIYKINITIMGILLLTFLFSVLLQTSFESRIAKILSKVNGDNLLPQKPIDVSELKKNKLVASLATFE